ncbi:MAG TPA: type VI secretion system protein TssA [Longimicrobiaceae bacterium]
MPLEASELLDPIPGSNPGGEYLRYEPIYDQIRQARTEEEDLPSGEWERERKTADYGQVIRLAQDILAKRSKDLQVAAWLTEALLKREGFAGLAAGLEVIRGLLDGFWDHLHPELEDDDAELRAAPLVWVGEYLDRAVRMTPVVQEGYDMAAYRDSRAVGYEEEADTYEKRDARNAAIGAGKMTAEEFDAAFNGTPKAWYRQQVADIDRALEAIGALEKVSDEKFGRDAPRFSPLTGAIQEVRQVMAQLLAQKLVKEPDPVDPAAQAAVSPGAPVGGEAAARPSAPAGGVSVPGLYAGPPAAAAPVTGRAAADASIAAAARFLRKESPTDPGSYLMLRGLRWGELRAGGGQVDATLLAAPPTEVRTRVKALLMEEKWQDLLDAAEEVMATAYGRGWLDLQRYVVAAADALGDDYAPVAAAVRGALRGLLADRPELAVMTLADDTPTVNAETRAWLRTEGMLPEGREVDRPETPAPPRRPRFDPQARARELASGGQINQAVDLLMREAAQERSPRGRFLRRTQAAAILVEAGLASVALPILEDLSETISQHNLEAWEDAETVAEPLGLLYRCHTALDGDGSSVHDLFVRVCRLDPLLAIRFGPARPSE